MDKYLSVLRSILQLSFEIGVIGIGGLYVVKAWIGLGGGQVLRFLTLGRRVGEKAISVLSMCLVIGSSLLLTAFPDKYATRVVASAQIAAPGNYLVVSAVLFFGLGVGIGCLILGLLIIAQGGLKGKHDRNRLEAGVYGISVEDDGESKGGFHAEVLDEHCKIERGHGFSDN